MSESTPYQLDVERGLYSGLNIALKDGTYHIGSAVNADIVFVEQSLIDQHFKLTLSDGDIEIEALGEGVVVDDESPLEIGARAEYSMPAVIRAGEITIRISDIRAKRQLLPFTKGSSARAAGMGLCLFGIVALLAFAIYTANRDEAANNISSAQAAEVPTIVGSVSRRLDETETEKAAQALKEQIERTGLLNIHVTSGAGVVTAEGTIPPILEPDWQNLQKWFDHRYTSSLTLVNGVSVREEKLPSSIAVEAVWQGPQPYLLIRGQKYFVGAMLDDGWTIHRIEDDRVLLRNEERMAAVKF